MQADNLRYAQNPNPSNVDKQTAQSKVIEFLIEKLPNFHYTNVSEAEEEISQELIIYLQRKAISESVLFFFKAEYKEGKRKVDFGILTTQSYSDSKAFFVIEAKRLPARDKESEREYVFGNYGGIERFKRNFHGRGLSQSAIIGYVQKKDFSHWHTEINSWINESARKDPFWSKEDLLIKEFLENKIAKSISNHSRIDKSKICLVHLWIKVNQ
jgi:hypothetical protein